MAKGSSPWTIMALIGAVIIFIWALLKSIGIIQSPIWVEMIPVFGGAMAAGGVVQSLREVCKKVDKLEDKVDNVSSKVLIIETALNPPQIKIEGMKPKAFQEEEKVKKRGRKKS